LMEAFAESLGLPSHVFVDMFEGTTTADHQATEEKDENPQEEKVANTAAGGDFGTIRLLHYPSMDSAAAAKTNVGISAHTDFEAFTLMHQSAPGLQLLPPLTSGSGDDGQPPAQREWMDAPVRPGEFLVIVGDALEPCTNGLFQATPHRVLKTAHARWSIIRFNAFAADTILAPLEKFCDDQRPAAYAPVTMKVHMDTTIQNLELGIGAWDEEKQQSRTANYVYVNGQDHRALS
jgi:isopenicillin N synthase-like dioxygenase